LQFHREKDESWYVLEGRAELQLGEVGQAVLKTEIVGPGAAFRFRPGTVHRVRALEDTTILEVSTAELDDIVRLDDEYGREGTSQPSHKSVNVPGCGVADRHPGRRTHRVVPQDAPLPGASRAGDSSSQRGRLPAIRTARAEPAALARRAATPLWRWHRRARFHRASAAGACAAGRR